MAQLTVQFFDKGKKIKENMMRLQRYADGNEVQTVYLDTQFPEVPWDKITIFFWNAESKKTIRLDELRVEIFE